jgi:hypothetical protein
VAQAEDFIDLRIERNFFCGRECFRTGLGRRRRRLRLRTRTAAIL